MHRLFVKEIKLMCLLSCISLFILFVFPVTVYSIQKINATLEVNPLNYGAIGDGVEDDSVAVQKALTACSKKSLVCKLPKGRIFYITQPLFLWGEASLVGEDKTATLLFNVKSSPYLLNIGISGRNKLESPFTGAVSNLTFKVIGGESGRIIFFWRTSGASIIDNDFDVGEYSYSATSSGNDNAWVKNGFQNTVRKNISIMRNTITASSGYLGSEGIGLGHFDGAVIADNKVTGVGDDPIGVHFSKNVKIINNTLKSVDGRLFVVNSRNVEISGNVHHRMPSLLDNKFYRGISLIYIGFELHDTKNNLSAPTNINIYDNHLYYPPGSIDAGAAIYLYGPRMVDVRRNKIVNDSNKVIATAIHVLPAEFTADWEDPDKKDINNTARVGDVFIFNNIASGKFPQKMIMTGNCIEYVGNIVIKNNTASAYQFYCPDVYSFNNTKYN